MMSFPVQSRASNGSHFAFASLLGLLLVGLLTLSACSRAQPAAADTIPLDQAGMWANSVEELRALKISNAEISELAKARQAGFSDPSCVTLIKVARSHQKPFADGQSVVSLISVGSSEQTVLELARLNQLSLYAGEAQAMRLAGLSDTVVLGVAQRRSQGLPVLSGDKLAALKNAGVNDAELLDMIHKGVTEEQASRYISQRQNAAGGHGFVYQGRSRRKH